MNWQKIIEIFQFLMANKDAIKQFIDLIKGIFAQSNVMTGASPEAITDSVMLGLQCPDLTTIVEARGENIRNLIQWVITHQDEIKQLIEFFRTIATIV